MRITLNGIDIVVTGCTVTASINEITRAFEFTSSDESQRYKVGDVVEISTDNDIIMIRAEIEFVQVSGTSFTYGGRNATKQLVKSYADKTVQFSKGEKLTTIIDYFSKNYYIKVSGVASLPAESTTTILVGDNLATVFMQLARVADCVLYSDAIGNLVVEGKPRKGYLSYDYGRNISSRACVNNQSEQCDKYVVISQSSALQGGDLLPDIQGSVGDGITAKCFITRSNLNAFECDTIAKSESRRDSRKAFSYTAIVDSGMFSDINTVNVVSDNTVGLNENMTVVAYVATLGLSTNEIAITFQKTNNE